MSHAFFIQNCCWITQQFYIIKDERLVSKMEGKTNVSMRLKQFDGLTWLKLTPPPLFYDRSTPLCLVMLSHGCYPCKTLRYELR